MGYRSYLVPSSTYIYIDVYVLLQCWHYKQTALPVVTLRRQGRRARSQYTSDLEYLGGDGRVPVTANSRIGGNGIYKLNNIVR